MTPQSPNVPEEVEGGSPSSVLPDMQKKVYVIYLSSHYSEIEAAAEQGRISRLGIKSEIYPVIVNNRTWYRLRGSTHATKDEASTHLDEVKSQPGLTDAWIGISNE